MAKYGAVGRQVRAMMSALTPLVEPLSIDEAFLDLSGTARVHQASAAVTLARFAALVESEIGIDVSVGLSYCKFSRRSRQTTTSRGATPLLAAATPRHSWRPSRSAPFGA